MPESHDIFQGRLLYAAGRQAGQEAAFDGDRFLVPGLAEIRRTRGVCLLRTLGDRQVDVSGEYVSEKILEDGDRLTLGEMILEFRSSGLPVADGDAIRRRRLAHAAILLLGLITLGLLAVHPPAGREAEPSPPVRPARPVAPPAPKPVPLRGLSVEERVGLARLRLQAAKTFYAEAAAADGNLFRALCAAQAVVDDLKDEPSAAALCAEANGLAERVYKDLNARLEYLKTNGLVAKNTDQTDDLLEILRMMLRTMPDPSDGYNQWAQDKLLGLTGP